MDRMPIKQRFKCGGFLLMLILLNLQSFATIWYVNIRISSGITKDGSSWDLALNSLQSALDKASSGDQIWIARGTYRPSSTYDLENTSKNRHFRMKEGVAIYGGFYGDETDPSERLYYIYTLNPLKSPYQTILSGDLNGDDSTVGRSDNCYHVFYHPSETNLTNSATLNGVTITGGTADNDYVPNCHGGGMYNISCSPTLIDVAFVSNSASIYGGGLCNSDSSSPILTNVQFISNSGGDGGGMCNSVSSAPTLTNVTFTSNSASYNGGGLYNYQSSPTIINATFTSNSASYSGGGLYNFESAPTITNAIFSSNTATTYGGGIGNNETSPAVLNNVTLASNSSNSGGAICISGSPLTLNNCIIWGNTANSGAQFYIENSTLNLNYCCYAGTNSGITTSNCITSDPLFADIANGSYRLAGNSPCINTGNDAYNSQSTDIRGLTRKNGTIDMGAYEWVSVTDPEYATYTWTGTSNSDWATTTNWFGGVIPIATTHVTIPSGLTNYPVISAKTEANCYNLIVKTGATLTIASTNEGTGSLIVNGTSSGTVKAQSYLTKDQWHIISPIVYGQSITDFLTANSNIPANGSSRGMMDYNTSSNSWNTYFTAGTEGTISIGRGYSVRIATSDGTISYSGALFRGAKTLSINSAGEGWNCLGNPYSSAIGMNSSALTTENFLSKNSSSLDPSYACVYVWNDASSCYRILGNVSFGTRDLGGNYLQSGQGFFVKTASGATSISFTSAMQSHQTATTVKSAQISWPTIRLNMANGTNTASTVIAFNNQMTNGLDVTYDAGLLRGTSGLEVYSRLITDNGVDFAIQCLPENYSSLVIPIGVESKTGGEITFSAETVQLPADCSVILEDRTNKTFTSLAAGATYKTTVSTGTTTIGRFYIHTSNVTTGTTAELLSSFNLRAYPADELIWIIGEVSSAAKASLFDVSGRTLGTYRLQEGDRNSIPASGLKPGVYLLKVTDGNNRFNTKMVIY